MAWVWIVILAALMIPLAAVVLDSPVVRQWADRDRVKDEPSGDAAQLGKRVAVLESELEATNRQLAQLQEGHQFLQRLIEDPAKQSPRQLPKSSTD
jgi:hypothetical protein